MIIKIINSKFQCNCFFSSIFCLILFFFIETNSKQYYHYKIIQFYRYSITLTKQISKITSLARVKYERYLLFYTFPTAKLSSVSGLIMARVK